MDGANNSGQPPRATELQMNTVVLIWMWPFDVEHDIQYHTFNITGCRVTADKSVYHKAHGVLFHHNDIKKTTMPTEQRPRFQMWIWFNMKLPANVAMKANNAKLFTQRLLGWKC